MLEGITKHDLARETGSPRDSTIEETSHATLVVEVRRSNKVIRPPHKLSPSTNYYC